MMSVRVLIAGALALASPVCAQTVDKASEPSANASSRPSPVVKRVKAKPDKDKPVAPTPPGQTVVVTAKASAYRSSIDRRSYSVANDLQKAAGGSVADILRNVPSVEVDVQGNVSLRGDPSVTILIDGQPSALMKGQTRSDVLQQLPADQIERVEVMTNPSAAFTPEGTGGVINLITKKSAQNVAKTTGSVKGSYGTGGRYNGSANETYSLKGLTLTGSEFFRRNESGYSGITTQQLTDPVTGAVSQNLSTFSNRSHSVSGSVRGGLDYDLSDQTRLSAQAVYFGNKLQSNTAGDYSSNANSGLASEGYSSVESYRGRFDGFGGAATLLRKLGGEEHEISVRLSHDDFISRSSSDTQLQYANPTQPDLYQSLFNREGDVSTSMKAEYKGPLPGSSKLVAGYEFDLEQDNLDHRGELGTNAAAAAPAGALTNDFKANQTVHALYATYQHPFGDLTVMPGLRLEEVLIDLDQITQGAAASQSYFRAYPTLHLSYKLDENRQITASYSQRVQRPNLQNLDPFRSYSSPLSYSQGNPKLEPETTDAYELGYEFHRKSTYYLATLYYRDNRNEFTSIEQDIGGGVILSTLANLGHSRTSGLELVANGELLKSLTYNVSSNVYWKQIEPGGIALVTSRSGAAASARGSLNWSPTLKDFLQITANGRSKTLFGQGYSGAYVNLNLGYRHKFDDKLALVATVNDPFDQSRFESVIESPGLRQTTRTHYHQRALFLGFTYALGTAKAPASEGFDFGSGGAVK